MSTLGGPRIVTDGLTMYLNVPDIKSFKGEPTTNLVSNPLNITSGFSNGTNISRSVGTFLNFTGGFTAGTITNTTGGVTSNWTAYVGGVSGASIGIKFTTTWYLKANSITSVSLNWGGIHAGNRTDFTVDLLNGNVSGLSLAAGEDYKVESVDNGFYRISYSSTLTTGTIYYPQVTISGLGSIIFGGIQIEQKPYSTPFVIGTRGGTVATGGGLGDLSGNNNHGELVGGPTFSSSTSGIIAFDGVDDYITLGATASNLIQGKSNFTIGIMFNISTLASLRGLMGTLNYFCGGNLGLVADQGFLSFYNDTNTCVNIGLSIVTTNKWIYAVATYDGTTSRLYGIKDGILSKTNMTTKSGPSNIFSSSFRVMGNHYAPYFTTGRFGYSFVYDRALSESEILQNYNATKSRYGL